jgi:hypothetical protein
MGREMAGAPTMLFSGVEPFEQFAERDRGAEVAEFRCGVQEYGGQDQLMVVEHGGIGAVRAGEAADRGRGAVQGVQVTATQSLCESVQLVAIVGAVGEFAGERGGRRQQSPVQHEVLDELGPERQGDGFDDVALLLQQGRGGLDGRLGLRARGRAGRRLGDQADPQPALGGPGDQPDRRQRGIAPRVLHRGGERGGVPHRPREDTLGDHVDRHVPRVRPVDVPAPGGFQPDQPGTGGRDPDRSTAVVGVRDRHDPGGHERRRTTRGRPDRVLGLPRVASRLTGLELGARVEPVLRHRGLPENRQPGGEKLPGVRPVDRGRLCDIRVGPVVAGHAGDIGVVLDIRRHAVQRRVRITGRSRRALVHDRVQGADLFGPRDRRRRDLGDADFPRADQSGDGDRVVISENVIAKGVNPVVAHGSPIVVPGPPDHITRR